ncbi:helix-turn-helix transcriptional regulator [Nonomuraea sp. NPDC050328]|uniref:helix-turn-helix transcriptional regulator n=1 Tax=Nonomuraea sp. NPDC050328 TaxID=3364361 RepID=UPI0037A65629
MTGFLAAIKKRLTPDYLGRLCYFILLTVMMSSQMWIHAAVWIALGACAVAYKTSDDRVARRLRRVLIVLLSDATNISGVTIWRIVGGNPYTCLSVLEQEGWVRSYRETPTPADRPPRYCYALTDLGTERALALLGLERHPALERGRDDG